MTARTRVPRGNVLAVLAVSLIGCASNRGLTGAHSGGMWPKRSFWPPPRSSAVWIAERGHGLRDVTLVQVGSSLATALGRQGYLERRWFPIGAGFVHGFAVSTRLEELDAEAKVPESDRWVSLYPEPANLFWLSEATVVRLPRPAQYQVLLLAFTDLPVGPTSIAPVWGRDTVMAGPEVPETLSEVDLPPARYLRSGRLGVYVYVYEKRPGGDEGQLLSAEALEYPHERLAWIANRFPLAP
jgi:hypothetical protein